MYFKIIENNKIVECAQTVFPQYKEFWDKNNTDENAQFVEITKEEWIEIMNDFPLKNEE